MDDTVIEVLDLCSGEHGATQWSASQTNRGDIKRGNGDFEARVSRHAVRLATRGWTLHQYSSSRLCSIVPHQLAHLHYCKVSHWKLLNQRLHR